VKESFASIEKLVEYKKAEILRSLETYWTECTTVYNRNIANVEAYNKEYDDYGKLIEKLADKTIGLDYLDRKIVRRSI
jgi:hypothetical protein